MRAIVCSDPYGSPTLSMCVPTWNRSTRLADLLDGIGQYLETDQSSCARIELVVVDNGSSDDTAEVLLRFAASYPAVAVRFWSNEVNLGADVNYLRALELARGQWAWLIGDDENIDPSRLPALLDELGHASGLLVLYDRAWNVPGMLCPRDIDLEAFLHPVHDELGHMINQIGVFVIERHVVQRHMRRAYSEGLGHLHAYAFLTMGGLVDGGTMRLVEIPGLVRSGTDAPRWNVMGGQLGAWRSSVAALRNVRDLPRRRESRVRAKALTVLALFQMAQTGRLPPGVAFWMVRSFTWPHKLQALAVLLFAMLPRTLTRTVVGSAFRMRGKTVPRVEQNDGY